MLHACFISVHSLCRGRVGKVVSKVLVSLEPLFKSKAPSDSIECSCLKPMIKSIILSENNVLWSSCSRSSVSIGYLPRAILENAYRICATIWRLSYSLLLIPSSFFVFLFEYCSEYNVVRS